MEGLRQFNQFSTNDQLSEREQKICQICYDISDGFHFGAHSCRPCAAFFRRTVTHNSEYLCRADAKCFIDKSVRNLCRHCRYQKCLKEGMKITAVRQTRNAMSRQKEKKQQSFPILSNSNERSVERVNDFSSNPTHSITPIVDKVISPLHSSFTLPPQQQQQQQEQMKILPKMHEGYLHFLSMRKATNSLMDNQSDTLKMSNFEAAKKVCLMEAHLVTSVINNYFHPFAQIDFEDKVLLFKNFFSQLSHVDRAYQSYKMFGHDKDDDRIIMPDGGYIKLSELEKYYENAQSVKAEPKEAAKYFRPALAYILETIIGHMKRIELTDYEYLVIIAFFLWQEGVPGLKQDTIKAIFETQDHVCRDLHIYYHQQGYDVPTMVSKTAQLMLLIPKIARSVSMIRENFEMAEMFNIIELDDCCRSFKNVNY